MGVVQVNSKEKVALKNMCLFTRSFRGHDAGSGTSLNGRSIFTSSSSIGSSMALSRPVHLFFWIHLFPYSLRILCVFLYLVLQVFYRFTSCPTSLSRNSIGSFLSTRHDRWDPWGPFSRLSWVTTSDIRAVISAYIVSQIDQFVT